MSYYIKLSTLDYPKHQGDIRLEHPEIGDEFICPDTYAEVLDTERPSYDFKIQTIYEDPPSLIDGKWYKNYVVRNYTQQELDAFKKANDEYEAKKAKLNLQDE
jgi:hypothetical protein